MMKIKLTIIFILLLATYNLLLSQNKENQIVDNLKIAINDFINSPELSNASISFYAEDIGTGEILGQYNQSLLLSPASTMKLFTTAAALEIIGPDVSFLTSFTYTGDIETDGTLNGDIYINGGGDPTFYSSSFSSYYTAPDVFSTVVEEIVKAGIKRVNGSIIGNTVYYEDNNVPSTWIEADIANYYGASPYALSIQDNEYKLLFKTGTNDSDSTVILKMIPQIPNIDLVNDVKSGNVKDDRSIIFGGQWDNYRIITGLLPLKKNNYEVKGAIPDPPFFAAYQLKRELEAKGIFVHDSCKTIPGKYLLKPDTLHSIKIYSVKSPPISEIIKKTNLKSVNLYAEHLLRQIGVKTRGIGSNNTGTNAVSDFWYPVTGKYLMYDGSGLSRFNAVSAFQLVSVLKYMRNKSVNFEVFYNSLPVASKSGSISGMFSGTYAEDNLRAKSGYMSGVRSYAGYVKSKSNKNIAFAVIVNNYTSQTYVIKSKIEKLLTELSAL